VKRRLLDVASALGGAAVSVGCFMLAPWLGVTVAGGLLLAAGLLLDDGSGDERT
jgi:hypothetical protein